MCSSDLDLAGLRTEITEFCTEKTREWSSEQVRAYGKSDGFREIVRTFVVPGTLPRDVELGAVMLMTAKIADVDIKAEMRSAFAAQGDFESPESDDIRDRVKALWEGRGKPEWLPVALIFESVNMDLTAKRLKPYTHVRFARVLRDLGLREGIDLRRIPHDGHMGIKFSPETKTLDILYGARQTFTEAFTVGLEAFTGGPEAFTRLKDLGEGLLAWVKALRSKRIQQNSPGEGFTEAECVEFANLHPELGMSEDKARRWLERALQEGELYRDRDGRHIFV